ncbi:hypothetical protein F5883DRAFT_675748 [Diaporthe sp. PMI_573]|nr:hypothetical protein F5883DRAFT_675748 [Diaporthaceae sp. PMI_573]
MVSNLTEDFFILRLVEADSELEVDVRERDNMIQLCKPATGIAVFQRMLWLEIDEWERDWRSALNNIERKSAFEISDLLDATKRQKLMYDDHNMTRSELYFTMDQLLRVFGDWTSDLVTDLRTLQQHILDNFVKNYRTDITISGLEPGAQSRQTLEPNWENLLRHAERSQTDVHTLVTQKQDEIRSLRDGWYNTIQVRESTKSTRMNQIMVIFTVATILYLPPTFGGKWSFREI